MKRGNGNAYKKKMYLDLGNENDVNQGVASNKMAKCQKEPGPEQQQQQQQLASFPKTAFHLTCTVFPSNRKSYSNIPHPTIQ